MGIVESSPVEGSREAKVLGFTRAYSKLRQLVNTSDEVKDSPEQRLPTFANALEVLQSDIKVYESCVDEAVKPTILVPTQIAGEVVEMTHWFGKATDNLLCKLRTSASMLRAILTNLSPHGPQVQTPDVRALPKALLAAQVSLKFSIDCLMILFREVGGTQSSFYNDILSACEEFLSLAPQLSTFGADYAIAEHLGLFRAFLYQIAEECITVPSEVLDSLFSMFIASKDVAGVLYFAETLLFKPHIKGLASSIKGSLAKLRNHREEHKEVSPDDSQRFPRDSLGILQLPVFSSLENDPSEESLTALSQQEQALYIMAHLDSMNSRQMNSLGLNEFKLSRLSTKAFPCSEAALVSLSTILSYCSEFFSHNTWDESSPRTTTWITLVSLRLLRTSIGNVSSSVLPTTLKDSLKKTLLKLMHVWKAGCTDEETIEYIQAVNTEAALTLTHSFDVLNQTLEEKLRALLDLNTPSKVAINEFNKILKSYKKAVFYNTTMPIGAFKSQDYGS
jgi:hypothetical protein